MKYVGFIVGLLVGAMFESAWAAILFACAGAYAGTKWFDQKGSEDDVPAAKPRQGTEWQNTMGLAQRVAQLEKRVATLEQMLAEGEIVQEAAPDEAPLAAKPAQAPVAAPVATPAPVRPPASPAPTPLPARIAAAATAAPTAAVPAAQPQAQAPAAPSIQPAAAPIPPAPAPTPTTPTTPTTPATPVPPRPPRRPAPAPAPVPLRDRLPQPVANLIFGGNMLVKLGVLILFLGLAFLLRYTAERVTVPIEMRYASVALVGAGLLVLGWLLRKRRPDYAIVLQGAGIGVFYLTTIAAMKVHALLPVAEGFAFLFGVAVLSALLAVLQNAPVLAIIAALEGFAAPVLASTGENNPVGLFTYLLVLDVGILLVAWFRAWRILNLIGVVGTFTLAVGWAQKYYTDEQFHTVQPFLVAFFLLFVLVGFLFARRTLFDAAVDASQSLGKRALNTLNLVGRVDSALAFGLPMAAFGMEYLMVKPWDMGPAFAALAFSAFYLLAGRLIWSTQPRGLALLAEAYAVVGVIFATLAIPLGLEGQWTGTTWAIEAAGMYWLGVRQQRPYARAFSFLVLLGAVVKLLQATQLDGAPGHPLLAGYFIGPLMVAGGAFAMWALHRRAKLDEKDGTEALAGALLPWLAMAALTLLLWQLFLPIWAAMATAVLASAVFALATRYGLGTLVHASYGMQVLAVAGFIANLQRGDADHVLANGWHGMVASLVIAASVLYSVAWSMRQTLQQANARKTVPYWSLANVLTVVTGVGLLHLSTLFQINLQQAALLWPLSASLVLWFALRLCHPALCVQAALLQGASAALYVHEFFGAHAVGSFAGLGFWIPVVLGLTALWCGDQLRAASPSLNSWAKGSAVLLLPVVWGLFWWLYAMLTETTAALEHAQMQGYATAAQLAVVLVTSALAMFVANRRDWLQLAQSTLATLPGLVLVTLAAWTSWSLWSGAHMASYVPSEGLGWLVWPLAVLWHLRLLALQGKWYDRAGLAPWHVVGFWFFLLVAAREGQWLFGNLGGNAGDDWSSWSLLGWVLVPALALWALQMPALLKRWPLSAYRRAYLGAAVYPVATYLLLWTWVGNFASSGNADPLPYLPLLNPLELGQWLSLAAVFAWWARVGVGTEGEWTTGSRSVFGLTAFALLTGMVLRSCHHFGGVAWDVDSLVASRLAQAALSVTWALCGVTLMVLGHHKAKRTLWVAGATLLGIVVLKLFFVELADKGGLFRIISFLSVGVLLLAVGYFAPVPPAKVEALVDAGDEE